MFVPTQRKQFPFQSQRISTKTYYHFSRVSNCLNGPITRNYLQHRLVVVQESSPDQMAKQYRERKHCLFLCLGLSVSLTPEKAALEMINLILFILNRPVIKDVFIQIDFLSRVRSVRKLRLLLILITHDDDDVIEAHAKLSN